MDGEVGERAVKGRCVIGFFASHECEKNIYGCKERFKE